MTDDARITVTLNGKERAVAADRSVRELIESLDLHPEMIVVELNREILERSAYGDTPVRDGDTLELVHFVGGG